jgi:hypothetical protein
VDLPEVAGLADDSTIVDIWMNAREIFVQYPKGLFVIVSVPDPGTTPPIPSLEQSFAENGGEVTSIGETRTLSSEDAHIQIVSLQGAYSTDQLDQIEESIPVDQPSPTASASTAG